MPANRRKRLIIGAITAVAIVAGVIGLAIGLTGGGGNQSKADTPTTSKEKDGSFNIKSLVEGILSSTPTTTTTDQTTVTTPTIVSPSSLQPDDKTALTFAQEVDQREQTALVPNAESLKAVMSGKRVLFSIYLPIYLHTPRKAGREAEIMS